MYRPPALYLATTSLGKQNACTPPAASPAPPTCSAGMANACSGALRMTCGPNHFGPIGPEFDPKRSRVSGGVCGGAVLLWVGGWVIERCGLV